MPSGGDFIDTLYADAVEAIMLAEDKRILEILQEDFNKSKYPPLDLDAILEAI